MNTGGVLENSVPSDYQIADRIMGVRKSEENLNSREDQHMENQYRKQKTYPLSSCQSDDREVQGSKRREYYDESESALSPPIDSQASIKEVVSAHEGANGDDHAG